MAPKVSCRILIYNIGLCSPLAVHPGCPSFDALLRRWAKGMEVPCKEASLS